MTEHFITLSTTEPNNYVGLIKLRQGDVASQSIQATITANGQLFNFDRLSVFFNAVLPNGNVVRDKVTEVDYANSKLNYIVADSFLQEVTQVTAWFSFENGEKIIDSTKNFQYSVIGGWKECIPQGNYIYELSEIQREIEEIIGNKDFTPLISKISSIEQKYNVLENETTAQLAQKPYQYNSLSDMKSDNRLTNGMSAITLGYTNPNDGGGGTYKIQSTSTKQANNGNVVALNNGNFAILQTEPYIYHIEQWGGLPSQLCDTALENIFKNAKENNEDPTIIFGYGDYNFERNHAFDNRIVIEGKGGETTTLNFTGVDTDSPFITIGTDTRIASVSIRDIRLKGNNKDKTGLKLMKTSAKTELTNVRIVEFKKEGLLAMGVYDAHVNNLEISDCGGLSGGTYYYGLTMINVGNENSNAWHVVNSRIERCPYMVKAYKTFSMQMTNCKFEAGDAVSTNDGKQPYILVDSPLFPFSFNACSFVATSVERIRNIKGGAFIPSHMVEVKNTNVNGPVILIGCEFISTTQGALFLKGSSLVVSGCTFNLTNGQIGNIYSIDLQDNSILSNSRLHIYQSQEGGIIPIFCNEGIVKDNVISMWTRSDVAIVGENAAVAIPRGTPSNRIDNLTNHYGKQFTEV
ncbi:MAG: BppU family phage baseplate upper protein [Lactococcus cremoris]|uniref:BppU family phage baseplate upper protein n=1 Tax=Lactococcus lactis subsp. cremoris TaxID=1359 RepID=UPI0021FF7DFD|nr:BppU family phage baseplate upper protein [Lactococcus cremoris]UXV60385.1 BppU family phage baseplate upper protein [Lactococcus cremoris]